MTSPRRSEDSGDAEGETPKAGRVGCGGEEVFGEKVAGKMRFLD